MNSSANVNQTKNMVTEDTLSQLKKDIDKYKRIKIEADTRMDGLQTQKKEVEQEVTEMGYNPKTIDKELEKMDSEIVQLVEDINDLRPQIES